MFMRTLLSFALFLCDGCAAFGTVNDAAFLHKPQRHRSIRCRATTDEIDTVHSSAEPTQFGIQSRANGDWDEAQRHFRAAIEKDSADGAAHSNLGMLAKSRRDLSGAAASLRRAIELGQDDDDDASEELGSVLVEMGCVDEAERVLRGIVSREPRRDRPSRAELALANLLLDGRGRRSCAYEVYREACGRDRGSHMAVLAGVAADSMGEHATAMKFYRDSAEHHEADIDTILHLMVGHLREGDESAAAMVRPRLPEHHKSSADYVLSTPVAMDPSMHYFTFDMMKLALQSTCEMDGSLLLEFGVYHGKTIRMIANHFPDDEVHGFDTFSGIPEQWHRTPKGSYSAHGVLPQAPANVKCHVGLFSETLPGFLEGHPGPVRFMNVDCDLYSSTKDVFDAVSDRIVPGTIIIFDEYVMNPHWKEDEYKAFQEAVKRNGWRYEYIGISLVTGQAAVRII